MSYKAIDVANHIIQYCNENNGEITNLKLQKILYYVQAAFLIEKDKPAFKESIVAWQYGPVIESVYRKFKKNLDRPIKSIYEDINMSQVRIGNDGRFVLSPINNDFDDKIEHGDALLVDKVVEALMNKNAFELVKKTHQEDPWKNTQINSNIECSKIKEYFANNRGRIYG